MRLAPILVSLWTIAGGVAFSQSSEGRRWPNPEAGISFRLPERWALDKIVQSDASPIVRLVSSKPGRADDGRCIVLLMELPKTGPDGSSVTQAKINSDLQAPEVSVWLGVIQQQFEVLPRGFMSMGLTSLESMPTIIVDGKAITSAVAIRGRINRREVIQTGSILSPRASYALTCIYPLDTELGDEVVNASNDLVLEFQTMLRSARLE